MNSIPLRQIDQTPPPDRYARGWHCLGLSASFKDKPKAIVPEDLSLSIALFKGTTYSTVSFMLQSYFMHSCLHFKLRTCQNSIYIYIFLSTKT